MSCVSVPVLSVHRTSIAPKFWIALSRLTIVLRRAIATAPLARFVVTIIGSISGVSPTATASPNRNASSQLCFVRPLIRNTIGTITTMNRMNSQLTLFTPTSNAVDHALTHQPLGHRAEGRAVACQRHDRGRRAADDVRAHEADGRQLRQADGRCGLWSAVHLLDGQRLARQRRLADEQVLRRDEAHVGRHHVARREVDDVAGHQLVHRDLAPASHGRTLRRKLIACTLDGRAGADERPQCGGRLARTKLLREAKHRAQRDHQADDDDRLVTRQPGDDGERCEENVERIPEGVAELDVPRRRFFVRDFVPAKALAATLDFVFRETGASRVELGKRGVGVEPGEMLE